MKLKGLVSIIAVLWAGVTFASYDINKDFLNHLPLGTVIDIQKPIYIPARAKGIDYTMDLTEQELKEVGIHGAQYAFVRCLLQAKPSEHTRKAKPRRLLVTEIEEINVAYSVHMDFEDKVFFRLKCKMSGKGTISEPHLKWTYWAQIGHVRKLLSQSGIYLDIPDPIVVDSIFD